MAYTILRLKRAFTVFLLVFMAVVIKPDLTYAQGTTLTLGMTQSDASNISLAVLHAAYAKLGIDIVAVELPNRRSLIEANLGHLDGLVNRIVDIEPQLPSLIRVKEPVDSFAIVAATSTPNISIKKIKDLSPLRVGIRSGIRFGEIMTRDMPNVTAISDWDALFDLLLLGRLDVVVTTTHTCREQRARLSEKMPNIYEAPLKNKPLFHYLHKRHATIVKDIELVLTDMTLSGEASQIRERLKN